MIKLKLGTKAFLDSAMGFVPLIVQEITTKDNTTKVTAKVTKTLGSYFKGEIITYSTWMIFPQKCLVKHSNGGFSILPFCTHGVKEENISSLPRYSDPSTPDTSIPYDS